MSIEEETVTAVDIDSNLKEVNSRISACCEENGRQVSDVRYVTPKTEFTCQDEWIVTHSDQTRGSNNLANNPVFLSFLSLNFPRNRFD
jgi:hypothetical protein